MTSALESDVLGGAESCGVEVAGRAFCAFAFYSVEQCSLEQFGLNVAFHEVVWAPDCTAATPRTSSLSPVSTTIGTSSSTALTS